MESIGFILGLAVAVVLPVAALAAAGKRWKRRDHAVASKAAYDHYFSVEVPARAAKAKEAQQ